MSRQQEPLSMPWARVTGSCNTPEFSSVIVMRRTVTMHGAATRLSGPNTVGVGDRHADAGPRWCLSMEVVTDWLHESVGAEITRAATDVRL